MLNYVPCVKTSLDDPVNLVLYVKGDPECGTLHFQITAYSSACAETFIHNPYACTLNIDVPSWIAHRAYKSAL